ncbi:MAG TPA: MFS transporter [Rhizomicrobium sp.]|nr:MFS transporter [Rhizomicrobium sp.]
MPQDLTPRAGQHAVWRLMAAQALAGANSTVVYATGAVIGEAIAPNPELATLPISVLVVGMASSTLPAGMIAERYGRRTVFLLGNGFGMAAGLLGALAITMSSFVLFCVATFLAGVYAAVVLTFRFAAAECVPEPLRPRALATVLAGGVAAGVVGGQLVNFTMGLVPTHMFVGTYIASAVAALLSAAVLAGIRLPPMRKADGDRGRTLGEIITQPIFVSAAVCGIISYLLMNFLMTSAPLAMHLHGHQQSAADQVIQWHVVAMYAPSFFTGRLITRYGAGPITGIGLAVIALAAVFGLTGTTIFHFTAALVFLGLGWNFGFTGASAMVLKTHAPEERARVQSLNDFLVFGSVAIGSFLSGDILMRYGWEVVCGLAIPPVLAALAALLRFRRNQAAMAVSG